MLGLHSAIDTTSRAVFTLYNIFMATISIYIPSKVVVAVVCIQSRAMTKLVNLVFYTKKPLTEGAPGSDNTRSMISTSNVFIYSRYYIYAHCHRNKLNVNRY